MGKMSRTKGRAWEQEIARMFRAIFGDSVRRGWQARRGGDAPDLEGVPRFHVEAKHHKVVNIAAALRQVVEAQKEIPPKEPLWPLVAAKSDRQRPTATMFLDDFLELLAQWHAAPELKTSLETVGTSLDYERRTYLEALRRTLDARPYPQKHLDFCPMAKPAMPVGAFCDPLCGIVRKQLGLDAEPLTQAKPFII